MILFVLQWFRTRLFVGLVLSRVITSCLLVQYTEFYGVIDLF